MSPISLRHAAEEVRKAGVLIDEETFAKRPKLSALVTEIIAKWSTVENMEGLVFLMLAGSYGRRATSIYLNLRGNVARAALYAVAEEDLDETDKRVFFSALKVIDRARGHRNLLAHGLIGHNEADPNVFIVVPQSASLKHMRALFIDRHIAAEEHEGAEIAKRSGERFLDAALIFTEDDLKAILEECRDAFDLMGDLAVLVAEVHPDKESVRRKLLERFPASTR